MVENVVEEKKVIAQNPKGEEQVVFWGNDGWLWFKHFSGSIERVPMKIRETDFPDGLRKHIIAYKDEEGKTLIEFQGEIYTSEEFVSEFGTHAGTADKLRFGLDALKTLPMTKYYPMFRIENDHLVFPEKPIARRDIPFQKLLVENLKIGPSDMSLVEEGYNLLRKHPKQWTLARLIVGANIVNLLNIKDFLYTIKAIGKKDTGKSFAISVILKILYGISHTFKLEGDALNSPFRNISVASTTDLPIYLEEKKDSDMRNVKTRGINIRGTKDQKIRIYERRFTYVYSANSETEDENLDEREAIAKRVLGVYFDEKDTVSEEEKKIIGDMYIQKIKDKSFNTIYEKLKQKTVEELKNKYFELRKEYNDDDKTVLIRFAEYILDLPEEDIDVGKKPEDDTIELFEDWVCQEFDRLLTTGNIDLSIDERAIVGQIWIGENYEFKISTRAIQYILDKIHVRLKPQQLARLYGTKPNTISITIPGLNRYDGTGLKTKFKFPDKAVNCVAKVKYVYKNFDVSTNEYAIDEIVPK